MTNFKTSDIRNLDVYRVTIEFLELCEELALEIPKGHSDLKNQLQRASASILLNLSEGGGKWSKRDKARCYQIAKGEAVECLGIMDIVRIRKLTAKDKVGKATKLLERIINMLTKMIR